jgi:hypothetical protein
MVGCDRDTDANDSGGLEMSQITIEVEALSDDALLTALRGTETRMTDANKRLNTPERRESKERLQEAMRVLAGEAWLRGLLTVKGSRS